MGKGAALSVKPVNNRRNRDKHARFGSNVIEADKLRSLKKWKEDAVV